MQDRDNNLTAILGPTNTGKTYTAFERLISYKSGIFGFPLRLLARENYDKAVSKLGTKNVALITGEEKIFPKTAKYFFCTVESMPLNIDVECIAIDEVQLASDYERGHIFTDRLLNMRGIYETIFLGSSTIEKILIDLFPKINIKKRERFSKLTFENKKNLSKLNPRSAIIAFNINSIYEIAESLRAHKGGAAVVLGSLSPRTRNSQVEIYEDKKVDFLVATDAIGMGLNLNIEHVSFSSFQKFDGRYNRDLYPAELGQIAGRAGRHLNDGTFGCLNTAGNLDPMIIKSIEDSKFDSIKKIYWRNSKIDFQSVDSVINSFKKFPIKNFFIHKKNAEDEINFRTLLRDQDILPHLKDSNYVRLLWDVCRIPDFRGISNREHADLLTTIYNYLHEGHAIPEEWLMEQIKRISNTQGDIDALSRRLAYIRTWTYVAQRKGWVKDQNYWREETRAVEDRLSDALHLALTQRFVDRRTSILMRRLKQKESLVAEVNKEGEVSVEGQFVGRLEGFRFQQDNSTSPDEAKTLRAASLQALAPEFQLRAERIYNSPDTEFDFTEQGGLMWGNSAVGKLVTGPDPLKPQVRSFIDEEVGNDLADKVTRRLQHFIDRKIATLFEPLLNLQSDESLTGLTRGFAFQMLEGLGVLDRVDVADDVKALDQDSPFQ